MGFRFILAIPRIIVLWFLFVAMFVVAVIGGSPRPVNQSPAGIGALLHRGVLRWITRVRAFVLLLTDPAIAPALLAR